MAFGMQAPIAKVIIFVYLLAINEVQLLGTCRTFDIFATGVFFSIAVSAKYHTAAAFALNLVSDVPGISLS